MIKEVIKTPLEGVVIIEPKVFTDARGYFMETFSEREFCEKVADVKFVQDNESMSSRGVVRGLHFQLPPYTQAKLVRCTRGRVIDVALDLRKSSPTYGQHFAVELSEDNHLEFYIPEGFAHGFAVLSDVAVFNYKCNNYYAPGFEGGVSICDESLGIDWKVTPEEMILSDKDKNHPLFADFATPFE